MSRHDADSAPAEPRWHRRKEERPAEILDAALTEFVARGFAATRLEDVARRAGCTKGTIFLYFANKEELFKALVRQTVLPRIQQAELLVEQHEGSYRDLLEQLMRTRWEAVVNSRASCIPKLMFAEAGNFPELAKFHFDEVVSRSQAVIERVLRAGMAAGEFRELDAASVARVAVSPLLMAAMWKHSFEPHAVVHIDPDRFFEASLELLLRGIARTAEGGNPR
jgi:AcrR family transcriptional regulator